MGYNDALDVVGIHGLGSTGGALATDVFAIASVNEVNGLLYGNPSQLWVQFVSVVGTWVFVYTMSGVLLWVVNATVACVSLLKRSILVLI